MAKKLVIDAVQSDNYDFEVLLKCYDENTSEIKDMKWPKISLIIESYTNAVLDQIENLTFILNVILL